MNIQAKNEFKLKFKTMSALSKFVRLEEIKLKRRIKWAKTRQMNVDELIEEIGSLSCQRRREIRNETRASYLAWAYLKGIPYYVIEQKRKPQNEATFLKHILPDVVEIIGNWQYVKFDDVQSWANVNVELNNEEELAA